MNTTEAVPVVRIDRVTFVPETMLKDSKMSDSLVFWLLLTTA